MRRRWIPILIVALALGAAAGYPGAGQTRTADVLATAFGYITMGWLPEAARQFEVAARNNPDDPEILLLTGLAHHAAGRPDSAVRLLERSARVGGDAMPELWALLGEARLAVGDLSGAEEAFEQALAHGEDMAVAYRGLGAIAERRGDTAAARERYEAALAISPVLVWERMQLARLLINEGEWEEAGEHLQQAARLRPRDADIQWLLGRVYLAQGEKDRAIHALHRALQLNPGHAHAAALLEELRTDDSADNP